jgi:hypothetical protein
MARAGDDGPLEVAFRERALAMGAQVVERVERALDVCDGDALPADLECRQRALLEHSSVTHC